MYDDSGRVPIGSSKLLVLLIIAVIIVMAGTVILNGGFSAPTSDDSENTSEVNNTTNSTDVQDLEYKMIGKNSYGTVTKVSGLGNPSSEIRGALILGVDEKQNASNSIVPTLQASDMLNYCYDVYIVKVTSSPNEGDSENNDSNLTVNGMSESLASEFVIPDITKTKYNFTVDIHSTNDSNSYVFVSSNNTYTSKKLAEYISDNTGVGQYTPDSHSYTESVSDKILDSDIPSIVYVTKEYYGDAVSNEVNNIISAIDGFDFVNIVSSDDNSTATGSVETNNEQYEKVINVSNSSGNREVN